MSGLDKLVLCLGLGFGIILQCFAIYYAQEFLGWMALMIFLSLITFLVERTK